MKMSKSIVCLLITVHLLNACDVSYPKETLVQSLEKLIQKECGQDSKACIFGRTLYLDIELDGLISQEKEAATQAIRKMNTAVFSAIRVVLSSDSDIQYMVTTAYDHDKNVALRIVRSINDAKSRYYGRISRSDYYESRNLVEERSGHEFSEKMISDKHDITVDEYVGRLIVSRINMTPRTDPPFRALGPTLRLLYLGIGNENLILLVLGDTSVGVVATLKDILKENLESYSKKYDMFFDKIIVVGFSSKDILLVSLDDV
ncbi:hypothetical protein AGMMS50222_06150 [Endomicrobiia bacterium]|nr:hypothetical protein AGMMS49556_02600 [Endomicrobiia bacterium]GHT75357.1 hypothetical protein AGMMS50222_06150 [Endomicrobiia bacterium]